jgi:predicted 2-oxoglutarate/Fe(II)-dependent dioxygenase YbiX
VIAPVAGQLVLFPSYVWHGTVPIVAGERLNIAFDVVPR